jgi:LDH2 family malate/lactate/ureidoglycolate dehydrogenase
MNGRDIRVPASFLESFMVDVFAGVGVPRREARVVARVLIASDLRGIESHGINRCKPIYYDRIRAGTLNPVTNMEVVRDRAAIAVIDGHNGMGHVVAERSMGLAIRKAKKYGIGMVAVRNSTHFGIAGYYATMASDRGLIGCCGTNARPSIAPTFGVEPMLGTNPLTFAMPTDEPFPFCLDCATSVAQRGTVEVYSRRGRALPAGWVIDRRGRPRTDTDQILKDLARSEAAFVPLGGAGEETAGYKGYGYATVVEILSSALQSANFMKALLGVRNGRPAPIELGHFFIAIDVASFTEPAEFRRHVGTILRQLRASAKAPGRRRIYTAGEREYEATQDRLRRGIPVPLGVRQDMEAMRDELGFKTLRLPWERRRI